MVNTVAEAEASLELDEALQNVGEQLETKVGAKMNSLKKLWRQEQDEIAGKIALYVGPFVPVATYKLMVEAKILIVQTWERIEPFLQ